MEYGVGGEAAREVSRLTGLTSLTMIDPQVPNVTFLQNLTNLQNLHLVLHNRCFVHKFLVGLPLQKFQWGSLFEYDGPLRDFSRTLRHLIINTDAGVDMSEFQFLKLETLHLRGDFVVDFENFSGMSNTLTSLCVHSYRKFYGSHVIKTLTNLVQLQILGDFFPLSAKNVVEKFDKDLEKFGTNSQHHKFRGLKIESPTEDLQNIKQIALDLYDYDLDFNAPILEVGKLTKLTYLSLKGDFAIKNIQLCTRLNVLNVYGSFMLFGEEEDSQRRSFNERESYDIENLQFLQGMTSLCELRLGASFNHSDILNNNHVTVLGTLPYLDILILEGGATEKLFPTIAKLTNLIELGIAQSSITDLQLAQFLTLKNLEILDVSKCVNLTKFSTITLSRLPNLVVVCAFGYAPKNDTLDPDDGFFHHLHKMSTRKFFVKTRRTNSFGVMPHFDFYLNDNLSSFYENFYILDRKINYNVDYLKTRNYEFGDEFIGKDVTEFWNYEYNGENEVFKFRDPHFDPYLFRAENWAKKGGATSEKIINFFKLESIRGENRLTMPRFRGLSGRGAYIQFEDS